MYNHNMKLQRFPLAILIFFPLFYLKSVGYAHQEQG